MSIFKHLVIYTIIINTMLHSTLVSAELSAKSTQKEVQEFYRNANSELDALNDRYHKEMLSAGWGVVLDPNRLANDMSLKHSKNIVSNSKTIANFYKNKISTLSTYVANETINLISDINDTNTKAKLNNIKETQKYTILSWDLELSTISTIEKIINFLDKNNSKWRINNNKIELLDTSLQYEFASYFNEMKNTTEKQNEYSKIIYDLTM